MGKKAKAQRQALGDAEALVRLARQVAGQAKIKPVPGTMSEINQKVGSIALNGLEEWDKTRVVLRADPDLLDALLDTDRDTLVPTSVVDHFPYDNVLVSLVTPFELIDEAEMRCRYFGVLLVGSTSVPMEKADIPLELKTALMRRPMPAGQSPAWTTYGPVAENESVRSIWFFTIQPTGEVGCQTITVPFRGELHEDHTVAELIEFIGASYGMGIGSGQADVGVLVPLSVQLLLYLGSAEPDLERPIIPTGAALPPRIAAGNIDVKNLGFRVGSAIRTFRTASHSGPRPDGPPGRHLPPHIRSAHWHRFRVATRDDTGAIVGDRLGDEDVDWHYVLRWIPPTPVNVGNDGPRPVVRRMD